ncbi:hypothetical protein [Novosphingobium sp. SCN 63-17]|uniref:hypothetical protein n=1 Tax=Novosphingobium sp. SCN 63-17 TaxID=1660120 RepID=UPI00086D10D9|nr:hypothetical protein [Novosphingobium sp. SCN 63-17]ODU80113.1 MAG: hypothetical protein ABT10_18900 [Novosphingobium sp. SCN 63-17]
MAILVTFLLGIGNFALHRAVMDSGHPLLGKMPWFYHGLHRRFSFAVEFLMLFAGLLLTAQGIAWGPIAYLGYTALNGLSAWLILSDRI